MNESSINVHDSAVKESSGPAEQASRVSDAYNRSLIEASLDPLVTIGADGVITDVNAATEAATGCSRGELIGTDFCNYFTEPAKARAGYQQVFREGTVRDFPLELRHRSGRVTSVLYHASVYRDESGRVTGVFAAARDITERKLNEERLRQSEAYLAEAQKLSHTGSFAFDVASNEYIYVSQECARIFELASQKDFPTREAVSRLIHPEDWNRVNGDFEKLLREKIDTVSEFRITLPSGTAKHVRAIRHPVLNGAGEVVTVVGTVIDITERKHAEEALRSSEAERRRAETALQEARAELERISRVTTMGELAASIAHEVNQPLAGVVTSAGACRNWLAKEPPNLGKAREAVEQILEDGTRAGEILKRIRGFLKRRLPTKAPVSLNNVVHDVVALASGAMERQKVKLSLELDSTLPTIASDSIQLQEVLLNLLLNASEAMVNIENREKTVTIRTKVAELNGQPAVSLEVSDVGIGFSQTDAGHLFKAFYTTKPQGMGMGLWISRSIVEEHGGRLTASSNAGPGATFAITFPAQDLEQA